MATLQELFDLSGQVAIVTGASSGLGTIFANALAEAGAHVVLAARRADRLQSVAAGITAAGRSALAVPTDVTDEDQVRQLIETAVARYGRLDILVNDAGLASLSPTEKMDATEWEGVLAVDLSGVFLCTKHALPTMLAQAYGRIINLSSILGGVGLGRLERLPAPVAAYAAAKGGVTNLTRELAVEYAPNGITVNAIGPAFFPSEMTRTVLEDAAMQQAILHRTSMGRLGRPDDLRGTIVFLASAASAYITGQILYVDGGWMAW